MKPQRAVIGLDTDQIDLEELTGQTTQPQSKEDLKKALDKAGEKTGFVNREAPKKKPRKRSPYIIQKNIKMRVGMPELLAELVEACGASSDQEALELGIWALIEKGGYQELAEKYEELTK